MKKILLLILIMFSGCHLLAQDKCRDIIKIASGRRSIINCCIDTVKNGNIVVYRKKGNTYEVKAIAITKDGERIDLLPEKEKPEYKCNDAVHPTDSRKSILNCCIKEIKPGNVVVYTLGGETNEIEAVAINYKGEFFDLQNDIEIVEVVKKDNYPGILYNGFDYAYYNNLYKKANGQMSIGIALTAVGAGMIFGSFIVMETNYNEYHEIQGGGIGLLLFGIAGVATGIPISISGAVKKNKYKVPLNEIKNQANLSIRSTNNGLGLVYKF